MEIRIIIIIILAVTRIVLGCPDWIAGKSVTTALAYPFFHANIFHLAANCLAIWTLFPPKRNDNIGILATAFLISLVVYPLSARPCVGISNLIFAAVALRTPSFKSSYWKNPNVILFLALMVLFLLIPQFSAVTHIAAFVIGLVIAHIIRQFNSIIRYARRYL